MVADRTAFLDPAQHPAKRLLALRRTWPLLVAVLLGVLSAPASALGYCRLTTTMAVAGAVCSSTGAPLYWPRQCINYSVTPREANDGLSFDDIRSVVDESFSTWTDTTCGDHLLGMSLVQTDELSMCTTPQYNDAEANMNSIIFVSDWAKRELPPEAFGLTLVWHRARSGVIVDADMQLNEGLGPFAICGARCPPDAVDLQNIITHEAGHFLGLGHSDQSNACMFGKATVGETSKRYLSNDDMAGICAVYGDRAEPVCSEADYTPDNGQSAECAIVQESSEGCTCSSVGAARGTTHSGALGFALLIAAACVRSVRRRRGERQAAQRQATR